MQNNEKIVIHEYYIKLNTASKIDVLGFNGLT